MPAAQEHHLTVSRSARYYMVGTLSDQTRHLWIVCHGYGQLAQYFIRHFTALATADPTLAVVAPEALSRFYLQGTSGRVGASWMTRDDRLTEIDDYVAYLNQLTDTLLVACPAEVKVTVLGFSQGSATVSRWLAQARFQPTRLVLWAGAFPPDMDFAVATHLAQKVPIVLVCGTQDEYVTEENLAAQVAFLHNLGCTPEVRRFVGRHELNAEIIQHLHAEVSGLK
ncbi:phospholipase [Hymenobacter sp. BT18]|uniref:alpha/beta hydrolase n=1 Tax=Hymenobacter sp. BT18 TaxID=2835648 RepID=UPI00143E7001|nr:phospholipase [Hymenobacter sp. BT18]QIX63203.1 phospholipase [Hymenobacter sp. BT18]